MIANRTDGARGFLPLATGLTTGLALLVAATALAGCAGTIRDRIYQPVPVAQTPVAFVGVPPQEVSATTADGLSLGGYYWPAERGNETLVVYFHGNSFNQLVGAARAEPLAAGGHGVLVACYRGYGGNPGSPTEAGLFADGEAWMATARALAPGAKIYLFGHSLGGAVALEMAARHDVAAVTTLGAVSRLADVAPSFARGVLPDRFDNLAAIARVSEPVFLLHGTEDTVVPPQSADALVAASGGRAQLIRLTGAGHQVPLTSLSERLWKLWLDAAPEG